MTSIDEATNGGQTMADLFDMPRKPLILEVQDVRASRFPRSRLFSEALEMYLERKGWDLSRVHELQNSISEKMTLDMFTGTTEPLDAGEVELQTNIDAFLEGVS